MIQDKPGEKQVRREKYIKQRSISAGGRSSKGGCQVSDLGVVTFTKEKIQRWKQR